ncbi:TubC N-terminal docking domain-related protein [Pedobacter sp. NJ-S-72]
MPNFNLIDVVELLNKANNVGIKITLDDDKLKIKMHKDQVIDSSLMDELKLRKEHLITYFKKHSAATVIADENKIVPFERGTIKHIPLSSGSGTSLVPGSAGRQYGLSSPNGIKTERKA